MTKTMNSLRDEILASPAASDWLKQTILAAEKRDPVDALYDAELLMKVLEENLSRIHRK